VAWRDIFWYFALLHYHLLYLSLDYDVERTTELQGNRMDLVFGFFMHAWQKGPYLKLLSGGKISPAKLKKAARHAGGPTCNLAPGVPYGRCMHLP